MAKMVDAEKLQRLIQTLSLPPTWEGRRYIFTYVVANAIDRLSVEVPDTPDVLGELKKWLDAEVAHSYEVAARNNDPLKDYWKSRIDGLLGARTKLAELQAKKEEPANG